MPLPKLPIHVSYLLLPRPILAAARRRLLPLRARPLPADPRRTVDPAPPARLPRRRRRTRPQLLPRDESPREPQAGDRRRALDTLAKHYRVTTMSEHAAAAPASHGVSIIPRRSPARQSKRDGDSSTPATLRAGPLQRPRWIGCGWSAPATRRRGSRWQPPPRGWPPRPLDLLLQRTERRYIGLRNCRRRSGWPLLFICGPPAPARRSSTRRWSITGRRISRTSAALFPRPPLSAHRLLERFVRRPKQATYRSYYGRTAGLAGTSDALHLWDRWLGADRSHAPAAIPADQQQAMQDFFAACSQLFCRPLVNQESTTSTQQRPSRRRVLPRGPLPLPHAQPPRSWPSRSSAPGKKSTAPPSSPTASPIPAATVWTQSNQSCQQVDMFEELARQQQRLPSATAFRSSSTKSSAATPQRSSAASLGSCSAENCVRMPIPAQFAPPRRQPIARGCGRATRRRVGGGEGHKKPPPPRAYRNK